MSPQLSVTPHRPRLTPFHLPQAVQPVDSKPAAGSQSRPSLL